MGHDSAFSTHQHLQARRTICQAWLVRLQRRRPQALGARGPSPLPARKGASEPLAAQQEENRSDVECADCHGADTLSKVARSRKETLNDQLRPLAVDPAQDRQKERAGIELPEYTFCQRGCHFRVWVKYLKSGGA